MPKTTPAKDPGVAPVSGATRDGQPLSLSRAPPADLAPWISRLFVTIVDTPADHIIDCGILNDTAFVRFLVRGDWATRTADGDLRFGRAALFFGPQSRRLPVTVRGPFAMAGFGLRPGTCHALGGPRVPDWLDRLAPLDSMGPGGAALAGAIDPDGSPEDWLTAMETALRKIVAASGGALPDPVSARFDRAAFADPGIAVGEFARAEGIDPGRVGRIVRRDFGLPPKQVLMRARALDMASHLRGVADNAEAEELALRYYDQSHLIREFVHFLGQTPTQFVQEPQPILTLGLEARQARRLEELGRLVPGAVRPWERDLSRTES
ncbi:helix-turn-helix domain-containing protein [Novosphingobium tardum]|uniref:Helix-turn-helix domain-containing protein n=1 Tax=Novosphingobium tardum TaxID=1538021 RepID=A0ABV8RLG8_9SPHN